MQGVKYNGDQGDKLRVGPAKSVFDVLFFLFLSGLLRNHLSGLLQNQNLTRPSTLGASVWKDLGGQSLYRAHITFLYCTLHPNSLLCITVSQSTFHFLLCPWLNFMGKLLIKNGFTFRLLDPISNHDLFQLPTTQYRTKKWQSAKVAVFADDDRQRALRKASQLSTSPD